MKSSLLAALACITALISTVSAAQCTAQSSAKRATFVELYTSQGCDSCPPADRWLSTLKGSAEVVPLSFHVDYWDYIGWKDKYASAAHGDRHRARVAGMGSRSVYTPQVILDGRDGSEWRLAKSAKALVGTEAARVVLQLKSAREGQTVTVVAAANATDQQALAGAKFYLALFENGIVTHVKAGENRGVTLKHDHVVRQWVGPLSLAGVAQQKLIAPKDAQLANLGIALVAEDRTGALLQALALPIGACS